MIHKSHIEGYEGSMEDLAEKLGNLKYDALAEFLGLLASKIENDGEKDNIRGRMKLANHLQNCSTKLTEAKSSIDKAWVICELYTK